LLKTLLLLSLAAEVELETKNFDSRVTVRSKHTRDFVCFNKRGRITVKVGIKATLLQHYL